jgi:hypothetical protein
LATLTRLSSKRNIKKRTNGVTALNFGKRQANLSSTVQMAQALPEQPGFPGL